MPQHGSTLLCRGIRSLYTLGIGQSSSLARFSQCKLGAFIFTEQLMAEWLVLIRKRVKGQSTWKFAFVLAEGVNFVL